MVLNCDGGLELMAVIVSQVPELVHADQGLSSGLTDSPVLFLQPFVLRFCVGVL